MPLPPLSDPPGWGTRLAGWIRGYIVIAMLFGTLFAFNGMQIVSLLLRPFSLRAFRAINRWGANTWWGFTVVMSQAGYGTRIELSGDPLPPRENAILLANHQQMADITFLFFLGRAKQRLGDMKWFVKDIIKWVPGVGWGLLFLDSFFVKRDWAADRASIDRTFSNIIRGNVPVWLLLFPEGTRITPAKHERGQAFARERGLPPLQHLLMPRTKGFTASVQGLRQHLHAVYDVTIAYPGAVPSLLQYIRGYGRVAHLHVRRFAVETLPEVEAELNDWLHQRWRSKDRQLENFYTHGAFIDDAEETATPQVAAAG
jgi:1-acyl-sn-glycerol-3-phosphate acyltransferase